MDYRTNVTERQDVQTQDIQEFLRVQEINKLGKLNQRRDLAGVAVLSGWTVEHFKSELRSAIVPEHRRAPTEVGLSEKEIPQYSILQHAQRIAPDPARRLTGTLESESSDAVAKKIGRMPSPGGFFVPYEVQHRDLGVTAASAGGYLRETSNVSFVELLRNLAVLLRMGATKMAGLVGDAVIPKQTVAGTAYWLATETAQITESQQTFAQISLSPKTIGGYTEISRQVKLQAPAVEGIVMADLAKIIALGIDLAGLVGTGAAGQPTGIINTAGIGGVTGTALALAGVLEFQTDLANALTPTCGYVTTPAIASLLAQRQKAASTSTFLWEGSVLDGTLGGCRAMSSAQMPAANILFGDFSQIAIGEWGVLEIVVDPFTKFASGILGIRALYSIDIAVRSPSAFSLATSVT